MTTSYKYGPSAALHVDWTGSTKSEPGHAIYFFRGQQYIRWNVESETLVGGYPKNISDGWPGLLNVFPDTPLVGAMHVPGWHNKIYFFFKGQSEVAVWDVVTNRLETSTLAISAFMPSALTSDSNFTPLHVDDGTEQKVYAFRGDTYTRWTVEPGSYPGAEDAGYPRKIGDGWTDGLTIAPTCAVNVNWTNRNAALTNRKIYFFLADLYTRWDVTSHSNNYRLDIPAGWKGWPEFG